MFLFFALKILNVNFQIIVILLFTLTFIFKALHVITHVTVVVLSLGNGFLPNWLIKGNEEMGVRNIFDIYCRRSGKMTFSIFSYKDILQ